MNSPDGVLGLPLESISIMSSDHLGYVGGVGGVGGAGGGVGGVGGAGGGVGGVGVGKSNILL